MGPTMSTQLIREQLSKRNLKEPTADEQISSSQTSTSFGLKTVNDGKTRGKRISGAALSKRPVEISTQTEPDRLVNGHSQSSQRHEVSVAHQNTCVPKSDVAQGQGQETTKAPTIDESLISDGDEGLPFISAVYSLASPENGLQMSDGQVTDRATGNPNAPSMAGQASDSPLLSMEKLTNKCVSGKDISGTTTVTTAPTKPAQSSGKAVFMSSKNDASSRHVNAPPVISSGSGSVSESSPRPLVSVTSQPTVTVSSPRGAGTGYNLRKSSAASTQASSRTDHESRVTTSTVTSTFDSRSASDGAPHNGTVTGVGTSSQRGPVTRNATVKLTKTNTVAAPPSASTQQTIVTGKAQRSSTAASSPVLISPSYSQTGARTDKAGQVIMIPNPPKSTTCAMTSLVKLVHNSTSSVKSGAAVAVKPPQMVTTKGLPVLVPATLPQQRVLYKFTAPVNVPAAGSPRTLPNQPVMITGSSVNGSQGQTFFQILTPDGPMLLVPVSKSNPVAAPKLVQIPVKGNSVAPVQIVKTATNTTGNSVPIAPHPGIAGATYPVILSASSPVVSQNASSRVSGLVNGGSTVQAVQRVSVTPAEETPIISSSTGPASIAVPPLVSKQVKSASAESSQDLSTVNSQSSAASKCESNDLSVSASTPVVSGSSNSTPSVSSGPSPQEARIQRLKELLRVQEQAVDRLRTKRQREMETVRESTIIGRSNADTESALESEDSTKSESTPFALPLPPKKMKLDVPHSKSGRKNEIEKKKAEGFLPNGDDGQFVQLVGLESIVEKLKNKKRQEMEARISDTK